MATERKRADAQQTLPDRDPFELPKRKPKLNTGKPICMLVDGDIIAYHVATSCLIEVFHRETDCYTWELPLRDAQADFADRVDGLAAWMGAKKIIVAFGKGASFRKRVMPSYKHNRKKRKPLGYWGLIEWAENTWECITLPALEADDVLGLYATKPSLKRTHTPVIVSDDKDMVTIPGYHFKPSAPEDERVVFRITAPQARYNHLVQTLTGDAVDGYPGVKGVGPVKAAKILEQCKTPAEMWEAVVKAFVDGGGTSREALRTAQVAHILQHGDYNTKTSAVKAWTPPRK